MGFGLVVVSGDNSFLVALQRIQFFPTQMTGFPVSTACSLIHKNNQGFQSNAMQL